MQRVYIVKTRNKYLLLLILARRVNVDEWWCGCSNATMGAVQPAQWYRQFLWYVVSPNNIFDEGWQGGGGGIADGRTIFLFDGLYISEKVWWPYDINMLLDYLGGADYNGALRIDQEGWYGGVIHTFRVLEIGILWCPWPTRRFKWQYLWGCTK